MGNSNSQQEMAKQGKKYSFIDFQRFKGEQVKSAQPFTVLTYNILAECYSSSFWWQLLYYHVKSLNLTFNYRKLKILSSLLELESDIICLQEVDNYSQFYEQRLKELGYQTLYKGKLEWPDGIVVGWNPQKFELVNQVSWHTRSHIIEDYRLDSDFKKGWGTVMVVELIQLKTRRKIVIVNAHLYQYVTITKEYVQFGETAQIMNYLLRNYQEQDNIILCGDLNQSPSNAGYRLIIGNAIDKLAPRNNKPNDYKIIQKLHQQLIEPYSKNRIQLQNAYEFYSKELKGPEYTFFLKNQQGILDYLFYNLKSSLIPLRFLEKPAPEVLQCEDGGLPNSVYPSDHLPQMIQFGFRN